MDLTEEQKKVIIKDFTNGITVIIEADYYDKMENMLQRQAERIKELEKREKILTHHIDTQTNQLSYYGKELCKRDAQIKALKGE